MVQPPNFFKFTLNYRSSCDIIEKQSYLSPQDYQTLLPMKNKKLINIYIYKFVTQMQTAQVTKLI